MAYLAATDDPAASPTSETRRTLLLTLGSMGASSVATGLAVLVSGHRTERDRAFARQFVGWGAINVAIAGIGIIRENRATSSSDDAGERRKLHRLLLLNSVLDVGYIAAGAALMAGAERLDERSSRYSAAAARGDGSGIMLQGAMLLALDAVFAVRTGPL